MKFCPALKRYITTSALTLSVLMLASIVIGASDAADWPWWRGLNRDGISDEKGWSSVWPAEGPKQLWKISLGEGYSTVSVSKNRV